MSDDNVIQFRPSEEGDDFGPPPTELLIPALEACLFSMPGVVTEPQLCTALQIDEETVRAAIEALQERQMRTGAGIRVVAVGAGWQLRTETRLVRWVAAIRGGRPFKLSRAALETLAVIAFRQPVSKPMIDDVRGVDSGAVLRMLHDRGLIRMAGRSDEPGRPIAYGTTPTFLELFGMRSLADLPTLKDLRSLQPDESSLEGPPLAE